MLLSNPTSAWHVPGFRKVATSLIMSTVVLITFVIIYISFNCASSGSQCAAASYTYTTQCSYYGTTYCCDPYYYRSCGDSSCKYLDYFSYYSPCSIFLTFIWIQAVLVAVLLIAVIVIYYRHNKKNQAQAMMINQQNYYVPPSQNPIIYANNGYNHYGNNMNQPRAQGNP